MKNEEKYNQDDTNQKRRRRGKENSEISKGIEIASRAVKKSKKINEERLKNKEHDNKKIKKRYIVYLLIIILVIAFFKYRHIIGITFSKEMNEKDAITIDITTSENKIYAYQNEILVYSKGKLTTYSRYGKKTWEYTFDENFIPEIVTNGKYIQVINKNSGYVYIFDNKYESCRKKIEGTIKKANINSKGDSVIHYSKEGVKSNISVYDKKGKEQYKITLATENIAKINISNDSKYLLFYEVNTKGISVNSILKSINLNKTDSIDTLLEIENNIIYDIKIKDSKIYALTSDYIYACDFNSKSNNSIDLANRNVLNVSIDTSGMAYIYKEVSDEMNTLIITNRKFKEIGKYKFNDNIKYFKYYNYLAYVVQGKQINIYNMWGMHIKKYTSNSIITNPIIFNNGKNIAIGYSNKIVIISI